MQVGRKSPRELCTLRPCPLTARFHTRLQLLTEPSSLPNKPLPNFPLC